MDSFRDELLFTEKYRPKTVSQCVLPEKVKQKLQSFVDAKKIPNMLLVGGAGVGKTTAAKAMCSELDLDYLFINASMEGNIDVLRNKIMRFASSVSMFSDQRKMVILDEADYLNKQSTQPALRAFMEEYSSNCGFIMTCNFKNRLIEPLHSRNAVINFEFPAAKTPEAEKIMTEFYVRCSEILADEGVTFEKKTLAAFVKKHYPDFRRVLNEIQSYSMTGTIDSGILTFSKKQAAQVVPILKALDFKAMRQWAAENSDIDTSTLFRELYEHLYEFLVPATIPQAVLILNEGQKADAIVADKELNLVATLTELMGNVQFRE